MISISKSLATLGLSFEILKALKEKGYTLATPIQEELIPIAFTGKDILAGAKTGTGKTAGFALPILQELARKYIDKYHYPKALILAPTRELAKQIHASFVSYGKYLPLISTVLYGGSNISSQAKRLASGTDIVIATSGRLLEHIKQKNISLEKIEYLVLDEADTILDMGFMHEINQILQLLPKKRQNILISATLSGRLKRLSENILTKPKLIEVDSMGKASELVSQTVYPVIAEKKSELLSYLIGSENHRKVLVFVRKKEIADIVSQELNSSGLKTVAIHGDKTSGARARALSDFTAGVARVMVATDIAARGLDILNLNVIFNYDIPHVASDFIHRIGRTGRAGLEGLAITLISPREEVALRDVEQLLGKAIPKIRLDEYAPAKISTQNKAARNTKEKKKTDGAFGRKKQKIHKVNKKRKTTKRDGWRSK